MLFARNLRVASTLKNGRLYNLAKRNQSSPAAELKRGQDRDPISFKTGDVIHGFKLNEITPVKERNIVCYELEHEKTGAKHLHIDSADTNNVFCTTFKTTPTDSTGVAHILEHTTLCGSNKYPVRDPFFNMSRRSLSTYMNAWTGADHTSYPFATQNTKDYYNLMSVYLDAVFYPKLDEIDFRQEGHRLEFENNDDTNSKLMFKGVVFNEMKGVLADPSNIFMESMMRKLFPTTTYCHSSGGEPSHIPDLSYAHLKNFHSTHYHPSNAWFFTYGDLPLEERLKFINENALSKFSKFDSKTEVADEVRWSEPRSASITSPPAPLSADPERQTKVAVSYLLNNVTDPYESFVLAMLSSLLTRGPSSPFYISLIDSGLGYEYSPGTGYDSNTKEGTFSIGVQGVKESDVEKVIETIQTTIESAINDGFPQERIDSILHQIEFIQKNITANFGMQLMGVMSAWIHGGNPVDHIAINKHIERLKKELESGPLFQNTLKKYLANNTHKITVVMNPDEQHLKKEADAEAQKLQTLQAKLTQAEKDTIAKEAKILKERQEFKQDVSVLPSLRVSDIPKSEVKVNIANEKIENGVPMQWVDSVTNGITYFRACLDISNLSEDLRVYLPLFASVLTEMGTGSYDNRQLAQAIDLYTGGIDFAPSAVISPYDVQMTREGLHVSSASLRGNVQNMFHLLTSIFCEPSFSDHELLHTLIGQRMSNLQDSINHGGSSYAKTFAASSFDRSHYLKELWSGMTQISFIQNLVKTEESEWAALADKLREIARVVLRKDNLRLSIVGEERYKEEIMRPLGEFIAKLPSSPPSLSEKLRNVPILGSFVGSKPETAEWKPSVPFNPLSKAQNSFFVLPSSVNYVAKCLSTVPYTHEDSAALQILLKILNSCYLHTEIREKGGAYGSGAGLQSSIVSFSSYRDPNITNTITVFDNSLSWVHKNIFTDQDIVEAKISLFSDIDAPVPPAAKGAAEFYRGITYEMRQKRREQLLSTERKDIVRVAEKYLPSVASKGMVTVLGGEEMAKEMQKLGWDVKSE